MVGIVSNSAALFAQRNLTVAASQAESSIARLSSGNAIIQASDDVSGLAIGTVLKTTVSTLQTILKSTAGATSLLSIADGALSNVSGILQRQKSLAVQSNTGSLSDNERAFLQEEFSRLASEIDRIVANTNFNNTRLIDGSIFDAARLNTNISDPTGEGNGRGTAAVATIDFDGDNLTNEDSITINGVEVFFTTAGGGRTVAIGGSQATTLTNLLTFLNSTDIDALKEFTYSVSGDTLTITAKQTGTIGNSYTVTEQVSDAQAAASSFSGGANGDLEAHGTLASATVTVGSSDVVGDAILTAISATAPAYASGTVTFSGVGVAADTVTINGVVFTYSAAPTGANQLLAGASAALSGADLAIAINTSTNPLLTNLVASDDGAGVVTVRYKEQNTAGNAVTLAESLTNGTVSGATLTGGAGTGIHANQIVNNEDFVGTIQGFEATYVSADKVTVQIQVGEHTYSATVNDTTPAANTTVRFYSTENGPDGGGWFDFVLAASQGSAVTNQAEANSYAARLDAAFSTVTFYQQRDVSASAFVAAGDVYVGSTRVGSLSGASVDVKLSGFTGSDARVQGILVEAPATGATAGGITVTLANGEILRNLSITNAVIASSGSVTLTSTTNPNHTIILSVGSIDADGSGNALNFNSADRAAAVQLALESAFGLGEGGGGLTFQVGTVASDNINVAIGSAATSDIYLDDNDKSVDISIDTAENAQEAAVVLDNAIGIVTSLRATVGALQSRFGFVAAVLTSSIQNTEAARSSFLDVDIANESTQFATAQVRLQASISVLAQANQIPQNLLKLIG